MKKFASVLLAVLVAFSMFSFVVSAAKPTLTVKASKTADIKAGDKVTVTVALSKDSGLGTLDFDLNYDGSAFKVISATAGAGFGFAEVNKGLANKVKYVAANNTPVTAEATLLTVEFEALKAADSTMSLTINEATDDAYAEVDVTKNTVSFKGFVEAPSEKPSETPSEKPSETPSEKPSETPSEPEDPCKDGRHDYSEYIVTKKACANQTGEKQRTCKVCGNIEKEAIAKNGKCEPGAWKVVKAATTTAEGEKVQECKICGEVLQRAKIAKLPSNPITNPAIPNTDAQA